LFYVLVEVTVHFSRRFDAIMVRCAM
ncbi:hypothetical protein PPOP_3735, partial [Paenibacillus popilliae ATCC 14706]